MDKDEPTGQDRWDEETSRLFIDYGRYFVPQRDYQMQILADLLSYVEGPGVILELCCGEGLLAEVLLERCPEVTVRGLDGSVEMLERAGERLARIGDRFQGEEFDLGSADWRDPGSPVDGVVSSMAVHHLTGSEKQELFRDVHWMLVGGGVFVITDIVEHVTEAGARIAAEAWDRVVRERAIELDGNTEAFEFFERSGWNTFRYLDQEDIDKPSSLFDQLKWLEEAGFVDVDVHWMLAGHAVFSAWKPRGT